MLEDVDTIVIMVQPLAAARFINSIYDHFPLAMLRRKVAVSNEQMLLLPRESCQKQWPHWPPEKGPWQDGME